MKTGRRHPQQLRNSICIDKGGSLCYIIISRALFSIPVIAEGTYCDGGKCNEMCIRDFSYLYIIFILCMSRLRFNV